MMKQLGFLIAVAAMVPIGGSIAATPGSTISAPVESAADVVAAFELAGLPVQNVVVFDAATDPNKLLGRPGQYLSKASFIDARHSRSTEDYLIMENTVEVFATPAAAKARHDYVDRVTRGTAFLTQYQVLNGRVLVRFDKALLPVEVEAYRSALTKALAVPKTRPLPPRRGPAARVKVKP